MKQIEASKLARGLGAVLEQVIAGERFEVVRYGRVVAVLGPPGVKRDPVQPEMKKGVEDRPLLDAKPFLRPALDAVSTGKGKISAAERQRHVDELLKGSRRND